MAKLAFGLNMSLDGYVDHDRFAPDPVLFRHFIGQVRRATGAHDQPGVELPARDRE